MSQGFSLRTKQMLPIRRTMPVQRIREILQRNPILLKQVPRNLLRLCLGIYKEAERIANVTNGISQ